MIDQKRAEDIVRALRWTKTIEFSYKRAKAICPGWSEKIIDDAADMISALLEENNRLSDELMVLRIKGRRWRI